MESNNTLFVPMENIEDVSPGGSPLTERKLFDFLTVNGGFTDDHLHDRSSNASTASSSLCPSPQPHEYESELENSHRPSLSPHLDSNSDEMNIIKNQSQIRRRHSGLTSTVSAHHILEDNRDDLMDINGLQSSNEIDKKLLKMDSKNNSAQHNEDKLNGNIKNISTDCYPNCDVNVWLRSCETEIIQPIDGIVTGTIPNWINGALLRNGPGKLKFGDTEYKHLFDSSALLHRFNINCGRVTYQCRFLQSEIYKKNMAANRIVLNEFGTCAVPDPCQTIFTKIATLFKPGEGQSDNAMISIYPFGDEYFAFTENPVIHRINPKTLATEARRNLYDQYGIINHTSHPHVLKDGTVFNLGMTVSKTGPCYVILKFPKGEHMFENVKIVASIPVRWKFHPGYMHTFGITENYFVIVEQPLSVSVASIVSGRLRNKPLSGALKWFADKQTHIYVVNRSTGLLKQTIYTESFFYLHLINQYEKNGHIVLDICCYKDPAMLNCMYIETMKNMQKNPDYAKMFRGRPLRFVLPLIDPRKSMSMDDLFGRIRQLNLRDNMTNSNYRPYQYDLLTEVKPVTEKVECILSNNLVKLENTKATAYRLSNNVIFCKPELLCDLGCETPRINYEIHLGREYRYFYAISSDVDADNPGTLIKVDVVKKSREIWNEPNVYPSEPIFVPSPNQKSEDDGVILAAIVWGNGDENRVGLLVLCAKTWTEMGRCEFRTPGPVPKCLHGWFAANKKL